MNAGPKRTSGTVVPHASTRLQRWGALVVWGAIRAVAGTGRFRVEDPGGVLARIRAEPVVFALWHNRLGCCLPVYERMFLHGLGGRRLAALVSASRDGAFLAAILRAFGVEPVRGSSSRRGGQALVEMRSWADRGLNLAITPDGPRGPRYRAQSGIVALARVLGRPIVPLAVNVSRCWTARSWDAFRVPLPFGRWELVLESPLQVPADADSGEMERLKEELERRLGSVTRDLGADQRGGNRAAGDR